MTAIVVSTGSITTTLSGSGREFVVSFGSWWPMSYDVSCVNATSLPLTLHPPVRHSVGPSPCLPLPAISHFLSLTLNWLIICTRVSPRMECLDMSKIIYKTQTSFSCSLEDWYNKAGSSLTSSTICRKSATCLYSTWPAAAPNYRSLRATRYALTLPLVKVNVVLRRRNTVG